MRVNTEDLWDASRRYERLAVQVEDIAAEIDILHAGLSQIPSSGMSHIRAANAIGRKAGDIVYNLRGLSGKLVFAISRYEEWDRRHRQTDNNVNTED